ncbi:MAG: UDP-N-acetylmuramoyl-L-alanyl-D-glutamate--2,6-diaminopimelate ligase [Chloroflexi bacterium]|nr:UDP-N-acetylmuramoyl-L-alanyl-D-glutamate--2,6-diaminopimelate ligase [Chloroflexota bacterium]
MLNKSLRDLVDLPTSSEDPSSLATVITGVTQDSRAVRPGDLFVAIPGFSVDGHLYIGDAITNGAAALVVQSDRRDIWQPIADSNPDIAVISVGDTRAALPEIAAAFHDFPAQKLTVVGVTGTDGKSTTTYLTHAMLTAAGHQTGLLNGVEFHIGGEWTRNETGETTPEADIIQARLAEMVAAGDTHAVLEVSSHGLDLHRADQINVQVAVFTGLSDDHLDFHQTREQYLAAKLKLFQSLEDHVPPFSPRSAGGDVPKEQRGDLESATAVVRAEDPLSETIAAAHSRQTLVATAIADTKADLSILPASQDATGSDVRVVTPAGALAARVPLPGDYNLGNAALAAGAAWSLGVGPIAMQAALNNLRPVPGRMESIDVGQPFTVMVDAAATGPALDLALQTLKPHTVGRLILVFGVAGERDPVRKSSMAKAAALYADHTVITNENPRSEDPVEMVDEIAQHLVAAGGQYFDKESDRRQAIERAISLAKPGDLVLIAGKGAEPTMIYADRIEPWDDRVVARDLLRGLMSERLPH